MLFRTVPVASTVVRPGQLSLACAAWPSHTVTMGWEDRLKARGRRCTDDGIEFATALPRGTALHEGDCLPLDAPQIVVVVQAREEEVLVIRPATTDEWALWGYHIGNSHQPMMIAPDAIVCADLTGMEQVLTFHGIPFVRERRAFTPVSQMPGHHDAR